MLPSKMAPMTSPLALIKGEPELPPMMSAVFKKLKGVDIFRSFLCASQLLGRLYGGAD